MQSVSLNQFEALRQAARKRTEINTQANNNQRTDRWQELIDAKKAEFKATESPETNRLNESKGTAPAKRIVRSLGQFANSYMAGAQKQQDVTVTPRKQVLGNYIDIAV